MSVDVCRCVVCVNISAKPRLELGAQCRPESANAQTPMKTSMENTCPHGKLGPCRLRFERGCRYGEELCRFCHHPDCTVNVLPAKSFIVPQCGTCRETQEVIIVLEPPSSPEGGDTSRQTALSSRDSTHLGVEQCSWEVVYSFLSRFGGDDSSSSSSKQGGGDEIYVVLRGVQMLAERLPGQNVGVLSFKMAHPSTAAECTTDIVDEELTLLLKKGDGTSCHYPTGLAYGVRCDGTCRGLEATHTYADDDEAERIRRFRRFRTEHGLISSTAGKCRRASTLDIVLFHQQPNYIVSMQLLPRCGRGIHFVSTGPLDQPYRWSSAVNPGRISVKMRKHDDNICLRRDCRCTYDVTVCLFGGEKNTMTVGEFTYEAEKESSIDEHFQPDYRFTLMDRARSHYIVKAPVTEARQCYTVADADVTLRGMPVNFLARVVYAEDCCELLLDILQRMRLRWLAERDGMLSVTPLLLPTIIDFGFVQEQEDVKFAVLLYKCPITDDESGPSTVRQKVSNVVEWTLLAEALASTFFLMHQTGVKTTRGTKVLSHKNANYEVLIPLLNPADVLAERTWDPPAKTSLHDGGGIRSDLRDYARLLLDIRPDDAINSSLETFLEMLLLQVEGGVGSFWTVSRFVREMTPKGLKAEEWTERRQEWIEMSKARFEEFDDVTYPYAFQEAAAFLDKLGNKRNPVGDKTQELQAFTWYFLCAELKRRDTANVLDMYEEFLDRRMPSAWPQAHPKRIQVMMQFLEILNAREEERDQAMKIGRQALALIDEHFAMNGGGAKFQAEFQAEFQADLASYAKTILSLDHLKGPLRRRVLQLLHEQGVLKKKTPVEEVQRLRRWTKVVDLYGDLAASPTELANFLGVQDRIEGRVEGRVEGRIAAEEFDEILYQTAREFLAREYAVRREVQATHLGGWISKDFLQCATKYAKLLMELDLQEEATDVLASTLFEARQALCDSHVLVRNIGWELLRSREQRTIAPRRCRAGGLAEESADDDDELSIPCVANPNCECLLLGFVAHVAQCLSSQLPLDVSAESMLDRLRSGGNYDKLVTSRSPEALVAALVADDDMGGAVALEIDATHTARMTIRVRRLRSMNFDLMRQLSRVGLLVTLRREAMSDLELEPHCKGCLNLMHRARQKSVALPGMCICISNPYGLIEKCVDEEAWKKTVDEVYGIEVDCTELRRRRVKSS
jgi:hypothetical protein